QGELMLIVGEQDSNVDPASTMQVVDALVRAGKDFDLLVFPGGEHAVGRSTGPFDYAHRRQADFFIRHLQAVTPTRRTRSSAPPDHPRMTAGDLPMRPFRRTRTHLSTLALSLSLALGAAVLPAAAQTAPDAGQLPPPANAAEARLRELYEAEWLWRQQEFARE